MNLLYGEHSALSTEHTTIEINDGESFSAYSDDDDDDDDSLAEPTNQTNGSLNFCVPR